MTLVILAAGMGSRYGGLKQIDPVTSDGEFIIDFSVYDAMINGFDKVVFVIKRENLDIFRETIGKRFEDKIKVEYAFQELTAIPEGFSVPEGRVKPWGTAHALLAARDVVNEPFAVINADDFYGASAYRMIAEHFSRVAENGEYCMVGYMLSNTLTENGTVSRGICKMDENGTLLEVNERTKIERCGDSAVSVEDGVEYKVPLDSIASMNCWGFTPDVFSGVARGFKNFLECEHKDEMKCEYYLPFAVTELMSRGECSVKVYPCDDAWYGVTYADDKEGVKSSIRELVESGKYPSKLN